MTDERKTLIPAGLIKNLLFLWIGAINIGLDFGLILRGRWNPGKFVLMFVMAFAIGLAVNSTNAIINLFKEIQTDAENQLI